MKLYNVTRDEVLASDIIIADTFLKRFKGLLGTKRLNANQCIIIFPCRAVHTLFMTFTIGVIFLDKNYRVIKILKDFPPWRISPFVKSAKFVVEMSALLVNNANIKPGDLLGWAE